MTNRPIVSMTKLTEANEALHAAVDTLAEALPVVTVGDAGEPWSVRWPGGLSMTWARANRDGAHAPARAGVPATMDELLCDD